MQSQQTTDRTTELIEIDDNPNAIFGSIIDQSHTLQLFVNILVGCVNHKTIEALLKHRE